MIKTIGGFIDQSAEQHDDLLTHSPCRAKTSSGWSGSDHSFGPIGPGRARILAELPRKFAFAALFLSNRYQD
ncbi:MAG TPA: hypothetical protein PK867_26580 [Pirellulales bacterium]|nr:hypothetical protein [Pirellulales bacterium]